MRLSSAGSSTPITRIRSSILRLTGLILGLVILTGYLGLGRDAWARQWKPSPVEAAQDYLLIQHSIAKNEGVFIYWFAPEFFEDTAEFNVMRGMAQQYMMVAIIHFSISDLGVWSFEDPMELTVELAERKFLAPLSQEGLPPVLTATIDLLRQITASGIGKMGEGMKIFVFDGTQFDRCAQGMLWINYLQERYEYETPLPGCS